MSLHRYWGIRITATAGNTGGLTVQEVELRGSVGGGDLTTPSTPTTETSFFAPYNAARTVDNDTTDTQSIFTVSVGELNFQGAIRLGYDFVTPVEIAQLAMWCRPVSGEENAAPGDFTIQYSDNGTDWTTQSTFTGVTGWVGGTPKTFLTGLTGSGGASNPPPTFPGPNIANFSCVVGTPITPRNVSTLFADDGALTYSKSPAATAWPAGAVINASTGIITYTPVTGEVAGSPYTGCKVRVTDTSDQTIDSNAFNFTVAASGNSGSVTLPALGNNTNSGARGTTLVYWSYFQGWRVGDPITITPIHGTTTTSSSGVPTIGSGLPSGTSGRMEVDVRTNSDPAQDDSYVAWVTVT